MPLPNRRVLIAVFITLIIVLETVVYIATTPRPGEQFFQLYVFGANQMAADDYPNNDPNVRLGESVRWYVDVTSSLYASSWGTRLSCHPPTFLPNPLQRHLLLSFHAPSVAESGVSSRTTRLGNSRSSGK